MLNEIVSRMMITLKVFFRLKSNVARNGKNNMVNFEGFNQNQA